MRDPILARAQVCTGIRSLDGRELPVAPEDGAPIVAIEACTICESDRRSYRGEREAAFPLVLGHEIAGRLIEFSDPLPDAGGGPALRRGERVTWSLLTNCGACRFCLGGLTQKCTQGFKYGHARLEGTPAGGFASHCQLRPQTRVFRLPSKVSFALGAVASCAGATAAAVLRCAGIQAGENVLILGLGMLGQVAVAMAAAKGAKVVATDPSPRRRQAAEQGGATHTSAPSKQDIEAATGKTLDFDVVFELSGSVSAHRLALEAPRPGGQIILAGAVAPLPAAASLAPERIVRRALRVSGVHNYAPEDLAHALAFLSENAEHFEAMIGPLQSPNELGSLLESGPEWPLRTPIRFPGNASP